MPVVQAGLLTILAKSIADNDTDTFAKSSGDTFTPILLHRYL